MANQEQTVDWEHEFSRVEDANFDRTRDLHSNAGSVGMAIAAFATESGGKVLFGQDDDGTRVGLQVTKQEFISRLSQLINDALEPHPSIEGPLFLDAEGKTFALIQVVSLGEAGPCFHKGTAYQRQGDRNVQMSPDEIYRRWRKHHRLHFEERPTAAKPDEVDKEALRHYMELLKDKRDIYPHAEAFMQGFRLATRDRSHLTSLGALVLLADPTPYIPASKVFLIRFQGVVPIPRIASAILSKPLHATVRECENFLRVNLPVVETFRGLVRSEETAIPTRVVREALLNLLAHRDYESPQETVIRIFDDRVEFINPSLTSYDELLKILQTGLPVHRNPLLYNLVRLLGLGEGAGQGIPTIKQLMIREGYPEPAFDVVSNSFTLTLRYKRGASSLFEKDVAAVYEFLRTKQTISSTDVMAQIQTNRPYALRLLNELVRRNKALHQGRKRNSRYLMSEATQ